MVMMVKRKHHVGNHRCPWLQTSPHNLPSHSHHVDLSDRPSMPVARYMMHIFPQLISDSHWETIFALWQLVNSRFAATAAQVAIQSKLRVS
jgi:hypothetical protein